MIQKGKRLLSVLLVLCLTSTLLPSGALAAAHQFSDVPSGAWYAEAVQYVYDHALMSGKSNSSFAPDEQLTRAMFVSVLGRMDGVDTSHYPGSSFSDVRTGQWYSPYIEWASQSGIASGYSGGQFGTNDLITREQMAVMLVRYLEYADITLDEDERVNSYRDQSSIADWALDGVNVIRRTGLMVGDKNGRFNPQDNITRAEAAVVFMRLHQATTGLDQLVGVYEGWYIAAQGETALTMIVYQDGEGYKATFNFYNLPGHTNAKEGSYTMRVSQTKDGFRFEAEDWIVKPSSYFLLDLEGQLNDDVLSGDSPTEFSVERVSDTLPDVSALIGTYEGTYDTGVERALNLDIFEKNDVLQAVFAFSSLPDSTSREIEGSYEMRVYPLMDDGWGFVAGDWIDRPVGFSSIDLVGTLDGNILSGTEPTQFSVTCTDTQSELALYTGPGTDYASLGSIPDDEIDAYILEEGSWIEVDYGHGYGYVKEDNLDDLNKAKLPYVSQEVIVGPTQRPYVLYYDGLSLTLTDEVNVYSGADSSFGVRDTLKEGDEVTVLREVKGDGATGSINPFVLIEYNGADGKSRGYALRNFLLDTDNPLRGFEEVKQNNAAFTYNGETYYSTSAYPNALDGWQSVYSESLTQIRFNLLSAVTGAIASNDSSSESLENETWLYDAKANASVKTNTASSSKAVADTALDIFGMVNAALASGNESIALYVDLETCGDEGRMLIRGGTPFETSRAGKTNISLASLIAQGGALDAVTSADQADKMIRTLCPEIKGSEKCSMYMTFADDFSDNPYGYYYIVGEDGAVYAQLIIHAGTQFLVYQGGELVGDLAPCLSGMMMEVNDENASRILEVLAENDIRMQQ